MCHANNRYDATPRKCINSFLVSRREGFIRTYKNLNTVVPRYTSCLDAKNFAWYTTFVWNTTRVLELV
jgi:hypothetical protein